MGYQHRREGAAGVTGKDIWERKQWPSFAGTETASSALWFWTWGGLANSTHPLYTPSTKCPEHRNNSASGKTKSIEQTHNNFLHKSIGKKINVVQLYRDVCKFTAGSAEISLGGYACGGSLGLAQAFASQCWGDRPSGRSGKQTERHSRTTDLIRGAPITGGSSTPGL